MLALLTCSVTMSAVALFYMAITPLLAKRYSAKGRYYAWFVVVIGLLVPFRPHFDNAVVTVSMPGETTMPVVLAGNGMFFSASAENTALPPALPGVSPWHAMALLWMAGVIVFLACHIVKHCRFRKVAARWGEKIADERTVVLFQGVKAQMGVSGDVTLWLCPSARSPVLIGFARPRILLPEIGLAEDELRFILRHELVHYKRKDLWYKCFVLAATAIHWFNPAVYLMAKAINVQCELSCDSEIVRNADAGTRRRYSETIIGVAKYQAKLKTALSTHFHGGKNDMKNRISSIMDAGGKKAGFAVLCGALVLTLSMGLAFAANTGASYPAPETAVDTPYDPTREIEVPAAAAAERDRIGSSTADSHPADGVSITNAPIDLTFTRQEVPIISQLNHSAYRALYMDADTLVRVTKTGSVQASIDNGAVWKACETDDISAEYMTDWLAKNDPLPDGLSRKAMLEKISNGAKNVQAAFGDGKEMYFITDTTEAQIELCTPNRVVSALLDGQRLMITGPTAPVRVSPQFLRSFYDALVSNGILTKAEAEQDCSEKIRYLEKNGFVE
jgi:beta-lactamase regulating signal transducer with metallopeptidase domain